MVVAVGESSSTISSTCSMPQLIYMREIEDRYEDRASFFAKRQPPAFSLAIKGTHPIGFVAVGAHGHLSYSRHQHIWDQHTCT